MTKRIFLFGLMACLSEGNILASTGDRNNLPDSLEVPFPSRSQLLSRATRYSGHAGDRMVLYASVRTKFSLVFTEDWVHLPETEAAEPSLRHTLLMDPNDTPYPRTAKVAVKRLADNHLLTDTLCVEQEAGYLEITDLTPGTLRRRVKERMPLDEVKKLRVSGQLNLVDYALLNKHMPHLSHLDLTDVRGTTMFALSDTKLTDITLPSHLESIPEGCFRGVPLQRIHFPASLKRIGAEAFTGCNALRGPLEFPEGLQEIGRSAFYCCSGLTGELHFPQSLRRIGKEAFAGCTRLLGDVTFGNHLIELGRNLFHDYGRAKSDRKLTIGKGTRVIGEEAFRGMKVTEVEIPGTVQIIGNLAFSITSLRTLRTGNGVRFIGKLAFNVSELEEVVLGSSVTTIDDGAFSNCSKLQQVYCKTRIPPAADVNAFKGSEMIYLGVPKGCRALYRQAPVWRDFQIIEEVDFNAL